MSDTNITANASEEEKNDKGEVAIENHPENDASSSPPQQVVVSSENSNDNDDDDNENHETHDKEKKSFTMPISAIRYIIESFKATAVPGTCLLKGEG